MKTFLCLTVFLTSLTGAQGAVVYLKDGSQRVGTVVGATARDILLSAPEGTLTLQTSQILRIDYESDGANTTPAPSQRPTPPAAPPSRPDGLRPPPVPGDLPQLFSFDFGMTLPTSHLDPASTGGLPARNGDSGWRLGVQYLYRVGPQLSAGLDIHYTRRLAQGEQGFIPFGESKISGQSVVPLGILKYSLTDRGGARPYVLAGLGVHHTSTVVDTKPLDGFAWSDTSTAETRRLVSDSRWGLASRAALGMDFQGADPSVFTLELGWNGLLSDRSPGTASGKDLGLDSVTGSLQSLDLVFRWGWKF